jgi:hypothetical protein
MTGNSNQLRVKIIPGREAFKQYVPGFFNDFWFQVAKLSVSPIKVHGFMIISLLLLHGKNG